MKIGFPTNGIVLYHSDRCLFPMVVTHHRAYWGSPDLDWYQIV